MSLVGCPEHSTLGDAKTLDSALVSSSLMKICKHIHTRIFACNQIPVCAC